MGVKASLPEHAAGGRASGGALVSSRWKRANFVTGLLKVLVAVFTMATLTNPSLPGYVSMILARGQ